MAGKCFGQAAGTVHHHRIVAIGDQLSLQIAGKAAVIPSKSTAWAATRLCQLELSAFH